MASTAQKEWSLNQADNYRYYRFGVAIKGLLLLSQVKSAILRMCSILKSVRDTM